MVRRVQRFLREAAQVMKDSCPGVSRHLLALHSSIPKRKGTEEKICQFCYQLFMPGNYKVRLKPKLKITTRIERLLRKEAKSHRLNLKQTKLLKKYKLARSVLEDTSVSQ